MQVFIFDENNQFHAGHVACIKKLGYSVKFILAGVNKIVNYFEENCVPEQCVVIIVIGCEQTAKETEEAVGKLKSLRADIKVIFCLGVLSRLEALFRLEPEDMLSLPVKEEMLVNALIKCRESIRGECNKYVTLQSKGKINCLELSSIVCLESQGRCVEINMKDHNRYSYYMTMSEIMERLPSKFLRCHQSYSVNTDYIRMYQGGFFVLQTKEMIPVSKRYRKIIKENFGENVQKQHFIGQF